MQVTPDINHFKDGRIHLNHGPIDLVISIDGDEAEVLCAKEQAISAFQNVLIALVEELPSLRMPFQNLSQISFIFKGDIAKTMAKTVGIFPTDFITPMAAVAGAVADYVLKALCCGRRLKRASVNNGGDIAFYLDKDHAYTAAIANGQNGDEHARIKVQHRDNIAGIATSGWGGRSHSFGIADSVTVLAKNAAFADTAATLIANNVDLPSDEKILKRPALKLSPDSDLGEKLVTCEVLPLNQDEIALALSKGEAYAKTLQQKGLIESAFIFLQGNYKIVSSR